MTVLHDVIFRTLADPTRRAIFEQLCREGEKTVGALTARAKISQPAVSKHLAVLKDAGLVRDRHEGRQSHYSAHPGALAPLIDWTSRMTGYWEGRMDRLEDHLHRHGRRQFRFHGVRQAAVRDRVCAVAMALPAPVQRPILVRAALYGEASRRMTKAIPKKKGPAATPAQLIDERIKALGDWRGAMLARIRTLIHAADPGVIETWKWRGVPVWEHDGIVCTGESYKAVVKLTFAKGASLPDPAGLFNSSLDGKVRRAIDIREGEKLDERAFKALIRAAVGLNASKAKRGSKRV